MSLLIYKAADHTNPADISSTWHNLIDATHNGAARKIEEAAGNGTQAPQPYEVMISTIRELAYKLNKSDFTFPPEMLIRKLEAYRIEKQRDVSPKTWVMDLFIDVDISYERIVQVLESMIHEPVPPFNSIRNQKVILSDALYAIGKWYQDCVRHNQPLFAGAELWIDELLMILMKNGLDGNEMDEARELRVRVDRQQRRRI